MPEVTEMSVLSPPAAHPNQHKKPRVHTLLRFLLFFSESHSFFSPSVVYLSVSPSSCGCMQIKNE